MLPTVFAFGDTKIMAKKKFYAIAKGRKPGIYTDWPTAEAQVKGFGGARFKGFPSRAQAEAWMDDPGTPATRTKTSSKSRAKEYKKPNLHDDRPKMDKIIGLDSEADYLGVPFMWCTSLV